MLALARHGSAFPFSALAVTLQQLSVQSRRKPGQTPARGLRPFLHGQSVVTLSPERAPESKRGRGLSDSGHAGSKRAFPNPDETQRKDV